MSARDDLLPGESLAVTVAAEALRRGEAPTPNVAIVCSMALARLMGLHDYTQEPAPESPCSTCGGSGTVRRSHRMTGAGGEWRGQIVSRCPNCTEET